MPTTTNSSSPSSLAFHFPSPIPKKEQPNTHPYAIKTSSTAILSRSNSTSAHASVGPHHYIPPSPSTTSPQHSPAKQHRPSRHRYSRSLTSDLPPALPPPPGASPSASPNQTYFSGSDSDNTPRRRGQRAETLPSSVAASPIHNLDLPDDPKTWTPSQLSKYLSTTLRAGDANMPAPMAKDIAKFVSDNRITGKTFLRFSEDDLLQFGINQLWRTTLLSASRSLRQTILRGRIWGFGNAPIPAEEDEDLDNITSSPSNASSSRRALRRRSRRSSSASSSSERGRVKDMVESLENASPIHSDSGNGHVSPTKYDSFSSNHHHSVESPTKHHRSLPHRGSVNDLFNPTNGDSDVAVDEKEEDNTIKNVAKRNLHGREPRMLPFPPTAPMLTPMHTGAGFPLPLSPEHTGLSYTHQPGADYEMGFRHHSRSPHSQVFVVRHNPSSPSNVFHTDDKKSKRLLPFPPMTGETQLHHPKPRRLIGTNTGVADLDSSDDSGGIGTTDATTSGTEGYETALETQSESESVDSTGTVQHSAAKDAEQPSIQELLVEPQTSKPISGVEAWELNLGETVKRIGADMSPNFDGRIGGSVAEIGRKAGRHPPTAQGGTTRSKKDEPSPKKSGLMSLFQPQEEAAAAVSSAKETDLGSELNDERVEFDRNLELREQQLAARERSVALRELEVERREKGVAKQARDLHDRQASEQEFSSAKQKQLHEQASVLEERQRALGTMEKAIELEEASVTRREENLRKKEQEVKEWEKRVKAKETQLDERIEREEQNRAAVTAAVSETPWLVRKCWSLMGVDKYLPPSSTSAATGPATQPPHHQTASRSIRRDILLGPSRSGGYLILMSIGVCVVVLRVLGKRAGGVIGRR